MVLSSSEDRVAKPEYPAKKSEADKSIKYVAAKLGMTKDEVWNMGNKVPQSYIELAESMGRWTVQSLPGVPADKPEDLTPKKSLKEKLFTKKVNDIKSESLGPTIMVDGKERPTTNNFGRQLYPTKAGVENFWRWFGESIATDVNGKPVVFFHGTTTDSEEPEMENGFDAFGSWVGEWDDVGNKFTTRATEASGYSEPFGSEDIYRAHVIPVYLRVIRLVKPGMKQEDITTKTDGAITFLGAKKAGAVTAPGQIKNYPDVAQGKSYWAAVFNPRNIKSAVGNSGAFSLKKDSIVLATSANRPGQGPTLAQRLYGGARTATTLAAPATKAMALANKVASAAAFLPGKVVGYVTNPVYNRLTQWGARFRDSTALGQKLAHGLVADYGLPEPYIDARNDREIAINKTLRKSHELIDQIASLDRQEARVAYLWMQEKPNSVAEQALMAVLPPDSVRVLGQMKQEIDRLGREAVRLGLLSQESFDRNEMAYLHRTYQKYELENPDAVARANTAKAIRADAYKGRGLRDNVAVTSLKTPQKGDKFLRLEKRNANGKLQNVGYVPVGQPIPAKYSGWTQDGEWEYRFDDRLTKHGEVGLWRDLTAQERGRLGEIDEVRYSFARTMIATVRDIETARLLDWVATNYGKSATDVLAIGGNIKEPTDSMITLDSYALNDWVQVPSGDIKGTRIKKYGALAGYHIPGHIWNDIRSVMNVQSNADVWKIYDSLLKFWKISKTALSPAVHTNNVMSNFILADLAGLDVENIRVALKTIMSAGAGNPQAKALMERFYDSGSELGSMAQIELRQDVIEPLLKELQNAQNNTISQLTLMQGISLAAHGQFAPLAQKIGASTGAKIAKMPFKAMIDLYRNEDAVFRLAKFMKETKNGLSDKEAGKLARAAFLDYQINAPWIQMLRRGPLPFLAFSYRAIPMMIKAALTQPEKIIKYAAVGGLMNMLAYAMLGKDGDEEQERKLMAKEKSGKALGLFPRMMRMPWNDEHGSPVFLDVRRWIPGGDMFDTDGSKAAGAVPQWLSVGGPVALFVEFWANKSLFTGKEITLSTDTKGEAAAKIADHLYKFFTPNLPIPNPMGYWLDSATDQIGLFQTYSWASIQAANTGATDAFGRERNLRQALFGAAGVKLGSYPADVQETMLKAKEASELRELNEQKTKLKRMLNRNGITEDKFNSMMDNLDRKREGIKEKTGEALD